MVDRSNKPSMGSYSSSMSCTFGRDDAIVFAGVHSSVSVTSGTVKLLALVDDMGDGFSLTGGSS